MPTRRLKFPVVPSFKSCCCSKHPSSTPPLHSLHRRPNSTAYPPPPHSGPAHPILYSSNSASSTVSASRSYQYPTNPDVAPTHRTRPNADFQWRKDDRWHVITKIHDEEAPPHRKIHASSDVLPPKRKARRQRPTFRLRLSTTSAESGLFSSSGSGRGGNNAGEESETLMSSSRSFSTDSSSECLGGRRSEKNTGGGLKMEQRVGETRRSSSAEESAEAVRLSVFQRLIPCTALEGKVRESLAVVKRSDDPYEDFRRSMMEMVLEKQMFEERDLVQLLRILLSLNSRHHHGLILEAFEEIQQALFGDFRHRHGGGAVAFPL
ncbi:hypothetical protein Dimus_017628 [Dionaea muscipula]